VFDECPGARDAVHAILTRAHDLCRRRGGRAPGARCTPANPRHAALLLSDSSVCTTVNTCFQIIVQHAARCYQPRQRELLQRMARHCMHEILQAVFARLPDIRDDADADNLSLGSGALDWARAAWCVHFAKSR
jgi:brefeldin A-resistance guanine nucleotide exchange factor 1